MPDDTSTTRPFKGHRWYETGTGRFTRSDPLSLGRLSLGRGVDDYSATRAFAAANLRIANPALNMSYGYAAQNPMRYFDVDGRWIGGVIGGLFGVAGFIEVWTCESELQVCRDVCFTQYCKGCQLPPESGEELVKRGDCQQRCEIACQRQSNCFWELVKDAAKDTASHWFLKWIGLH